jgi:hypothetical protein
METVKIVFDIDTSDVKTSTQDLVALNKVTETEVEALKRLEAESNANKVAFQQLNKELKSANTELLNAKKTFGDTSKEAQSAQKNVDALTDKMAELKNTVKPLDDAFVSLRTQVKLAKEEAVKAAEKYGEFSKEANAARVKAGALADQMGDLNRQVGLLNPEAKAKAFSNLAQGVVGAFSIATGALQAFGVKNKEVEELAMKLQGALNITQGIASFGALKESLQDIKVVLGFTTAAQEGLTVAKETDIVVTEGATVANKTFIASLATNPIFLVVAAIGALAAAYITLNEQTKSAILNEQELADAKKKTTELKNKELQTSIDLKVANKEISKQEGERQKIEAKRLEDTKELTKQTKNLADEQVKSDKKIIDLTKEAEQLKKDALKERDPELRRALLANAQSAKLQVETEKKKNAQIKQSYTALNEQLVTINKTASNEKVQQDIDEKNELSSNQEKANKEAEAKRAAALAKQKQLSNEQKAAREKQYNEELALRKAQQQGIIDGLKTEEEKIAKQREFNQENLTFSKSYYDEVGRSANEIALLEQNFANDQAALLNKEVKLRTDKNAKVLEAEKKLQKALLDLALAGENDPLKRAQLANDVREKEIDDQLALVEKGSKEEQILIAEKATAEIEAQKKIADAQKQAQAQDNKNKQEQKKSDEQAAQDRIATAEFVFDAVSQLSNSLAELQKAQTDQEIADLQAQYDKKLINEKTYNAKLRELKRKQWEADKRARIIEATMGIANGIINALSIRPTELVPYAIGLAGTVGALNLATIIAQKPPQFAKGTLSVPGVDMGRDSVHAMLQPGEAVIPVSTNRAYHPTIKAIYEKKISPSEINNFVMSRTSSGGKQSITANVDTYALGRALGKNKGVQIENANVVGRAMAKELLRGQNYRRA